MSHLRLVWTNDNPVVPLPNVKADEYFDKPKNYYEDDVKVARNTFYIVLGCVIFELFVFYMLYLTI